MRHEDHIYHRERERHCRSMAEFAADAEVQRRHQELAELHAARAAQLSMSEGAGAAL